MKNLLFTPIGRLRILGFLEGTSLLLLIFIAMPVKYLLHDPWMVKAIGPIHGCLFVMYILSVLKVATEQCWKFSETTWKVMIACLIPFGTFILDHKVLRRL